MKPPSDVKVVAAKPKPKANAQERALKAIERLGADVAALKQRASESGAANEDALKKIDLELAHMSREIAVIKDGLTSTVLVAALIERLIERLGD
jgi:hypothetical protein